MSSDPIDVDEGAEPSGMGLFDSFGDIEQFTADGRFREVTIFEGETPLATLIPFKKPLVESALDAPIDVAVKLSRFAYLHRVGNVMLLKTPLSGLDLQLHDPRAGALVTALAFDASPVELAKRTGVSVEAARRFAGALVAMSAAAPVAKERDRASMVEQLIEFSVSHGLPQAWDSQALRAALASLPWTNVGDSVQLIWELHHDGSAQADISLAMRSARAGNPALADFDINEYDITESGAELMGTFTRIARSPGLTDAWAWSNQAFAAAGVGVELGANSVLRELVDAVGAPAFLGVTPRRAGTRVIFTLSPAGLASAAPVLTAAGVPGNVIARLPLLEPLLGDEWSVRLAVDAINGGIAPGIAFEIFMSPDITPRVPGVLDALGLDASVTSQVLALSASDAQVRELLLAPGVVTDELTAAPLHIKIAFAPDGTVSAKTYIAVSNVPLTTAGRSIEDREVPSTWEFHDLLFHSQVRNGRLRHRIGGTARFSVIPELKLVEQAPAPNDVLLPIVDVADVVKKDAPFGEVLRARESDRDWNGPEIPLESLAELLQRVGELIPRTIEFGDQAQEFTGAPYPSGGGIYETDIVVLVHRVAGVEPGAYLYKRASRSLQPLIGDPAQIDALLMFAAEATGNGVQRPQALLVLAARFPDLAVKYEGIAYALMVKHVGVLQATIAYTATAMGLGAVPIGTGDSDSFAAATGLDYYRHGSIGEIALSQP